jgi:hypothetical protein
MKFICVMKQSGEGCDYTIGCGMNFITVDAVDAEEAAVKINKVWFMSDYENGNADPAYHCVGGEQELITWRLFEVAQEYNLLPILHRWKTDFDEKEATAENIKREAEERRKYEELKRKFG